MAPQYIIAQGSGNSDLLALILLVCPIVFVIFLVYKSPCTLKKYTPKFHDWLFGASNIRWPNDPIECLTGDPDETLTPKPL